MKYLVIILLITLGSNAQSAELYSKSFGEKENPAIIFLHGGPGYNCSTFEVTTAQKLADAGFYVIVYDRRGEGRSAEMKAKFNFKQSFKDIKSLYKKYEIEKATLMGHSFGGILATKFAQSNQEMVKNMVLVGAPVSLQESFKTIIESSKNIYTKTYDKTNLRYLKKLETMDSATLEYAVYCFAHAMQNGFYSTDSLTEEAKQIFKDHKDSPILYKYAAAMTEDATAGFWKNEAYTTLNLSEDLRQLNLNGLAMYGMYGKEDGLYSADQIGDLAAIIGDENVNYFDNCSHSVYIDQQSAFIDVLKSLLR